jgi:hypothetical protein
MANLISYLLLCAASINWGVLSVNAVGNNKEAIQYRVAPNYLPNNISYVHGSYKVVSMLFIAKAVLR